MASQTGVKCNADSVSVPLCWMALSAVLEEKTVAHAAFGVPAEIASIFGSTGGVGGTGNNPLVSVTHRGSKKKKKIKVLFQRRESDLLG